MSRGGSVIAPATPPGETSTGSARSARRPSAPRLGLDLISAALEGPASALLSPSYLGPQDYPWLRALLDEVGRFEGARRSELAAHLCEPLPVRAPRTQLRMAKSVIEHLLADRPSFTVKPREARRLLFEEAARAAPSRIPPRPGSGTAGAPPSRDTDADWRTALVERVAAGLGVDRSGLLESLFADLPGERTILPLPEALTPAELALRTNAALAAGLLARAASVRVSVHGSARAVVRHARRVGLLCVATRAAPEARQTTARSGSRPPLFDDRSQPDTGADAVLHISGPLSLFRHTVIYGRALASLLPRLAWCHRFELQADVVLRDGELRRLVIRSGDPLPPGRELPRYDSRLEERFARDFARAAPDWNLVREPGPVPIAGRRLVFPDFELVHRHDSTRRWLLEIVGFWTATYLEKKLESLRLAELDSLVLCIDETRNCSDRDFPAGARVVRFRRRIDPAAVLAAIGASGPGAVVP